MLRSIKTFEDLVGILNEQNSQANAAQRQSTLQTKGVAPGDAVRPGVSTPTGRIGNLLTQFNPTTLAAKIRAVETGGIFKFLGDTLTAMSIQKLREFNFKSQFPRGWPKKGSKFIYIPVVNALKGSNKQGIEGVVISDSVAGQSLILNIDFPNSSVGGSINPQQNNMKYAKRVVATIDTQMKDNPNLSIRGWEVQDIIPGRGAVRDPENSAHYNRPLTYDVTTSKFTFDQGGSTDSSGNDSSPTEGSTMTLSVNDLKTKYKVNNPAKNIVFRFKPTPTSREVGVKIISDPISVDTSTSGKIDVVLAKVIK